MRSKVIPFRLPVALLAAGIALVAVAAASGPILRFTATTANVGGAPDSIRIDLFRWSTDAERDRLVAAWKMTGPTGATGRGGRGGGRGAAGRGGAGRGGRGASADPAPDPDAVDDPFAAFNVDRKRGGEEAPPTPESTLAKALQLAPTVGYLWSSEVAGYALRYAAKLTGPDGGDRVILITERRLGVTNDLWKPTGAGAENPYEFSVIELRTNSKGEGEGRISLVGKVAPDSEAKVVAPENYLALPVVLKNLKQRSLDGK
jgi:hypothetical protein